MAAQEKNNMTEDFVDQMKEIWATAGQTRGTPAGGSTTSTKARGQSATEPEGLRAMDEMPANSQAVLYCT